MKEYKWEIIIIAILVIAFCWYFVKRYKEYKPEPVVPSMSECKIETDELGATSLDCPNGREDEAVDKAIHGL